MFYQKLASMRRRSKLKNFLNSFLFFRHMNKNIFLSLFLIILSVPLVMAQDFGEIASNAVSFSANVCETYGGFMKYIIGAECAANIVFIALLILWIFTIMMLFDMIATFSPFSRGTSFIAAFGISIIIANSGFMGWIYESFSALIANQGALKVIAFLIAVLVIYGIIKTITEKEKKKKKESEIKKAEEKVVKIGKELGSAVTK